MRPLNAEVPLRLKSPSRPWPTASCSSTPGQPGPSTTVIVPAGAGTASRFTCAVRTASRTSQPPAVGGEELRVGEASAAARVALLAAAVLLDDHRDVEPHQRTHVGRERAVARHAPGSCRATRARLAITCVMRGSSARASRSMASSRLTLRRRPASRPGRSAGTGGGRPARARPAPAARCPSARCARAACAASSSAGSTISSEYAKPVFSPASARTPTPWSMLCAPSLTMPSSSDQDSSRISLEVHVRVVDGVAHDVAEHAGDARPRRAPAGAEQRRPREIAAGRAPRPAAGPGPAGANSAGGMLGLHAGVIRQSPMGDRREILPDLALPNEVDVRRRRRRCRAAAARRPCPSSRRSANRRRSRGRSRGIPTGPAPPSWQRFSIARARSSISQCARPVGRRERGRQAEPLGPERRAGGGTVRGSACRSRPRGRAGPRACRRTTALRPRPHRRRLAVALRLARDVDVEQVDLVVARGELAVERRTRGTPRRRAARRARAAARCRRRSTGRARAPSSTGRPGSGRCPSSSAIASLSGLAHAHEREILGQRRDDGALRPCAAQHQAGRLEIAADVRRGRHLDCSDLAQRFSPGASPPPAASPAGAEMRSTTGLDHGPVT